MTMQNIYKHAWYSLSASTKDSEEKSDFTPHLTGLVITAGINSLRQSETYMHQKLSILGSDNALLPGRHQAII